MLNKLPSREGNAGRNSDYVGAVVLGHGIGLFLSLAPYTFCCTCSFCSLFPWVWLYVLLSYGGLVDLIVLIMDGVVFSYLNLSFSLSPPHYF